MIAEKAHPQVGFEGRERGDVLYMLGEEGFKHRGAAQKNGCTEPFQMGLLMK